MIENSSIALVSLGCAKNAVDLQVMAGNLLKKGCTLSPDPDNADVVIVNTCSFISDAREESENEILRALKLKEKGCFKKVIVTGCYPERYPERIRDFPGVDEWVGVPKEWVEPKIPALRFTGKAFAYLKIAEGCAHRCAYCAIPKIRGKYRSRPQCSILKEARALIDSGCKELNIVAQDPMLYGVDIADKTGKKRSVKLVSLLKEIDKIPGEFWVRVLYSYPSEITEDFVVWLMTSPHACRYVDVPLQHTVPEVLANMNRKGAIAASRSAAEVLRACVEGISLRTTIMTGFPGETEKRFNQLLSDIKRMQFDHLGAFAYSPEKGTKGAAMKARVSRKVALDRKDQVMRLQSAIWKYKAKRMIGNTYLALVVAPGVARMESQAPEVDGVVYVDSDSVGEFVSVKLKRVKGYDFVGEIV